MKDRDTKKKVSVTLDRKVIKGFKEVADGRPLSTVINRLLLRYIINTKGGKNNGV
jgi:uncharacterized protein (DUF4415 family)